MTPPYSASVYTLCATLTGQVDTATSHSVTIPHSTNSTYTIDNAKTYDIKIISTNQWGQDEMLAPLVFPVNVGAAEVAQTTAKLKVSNYSGAWWYQRTVPSGDSTCHSVTAGTTEASLSSLTAGIAYTYKTYSKTGCNSADEIATVNFFTGSSVSNLSETSDGLGLTIHDTSHGATQFTTGDAAAGYTLDSVTVDIKTARNTAGNLTVAIHAVSGGNPAPTATYTLSGANPTAAGQHTFTCSGSCPLAKDTTYFVVLSKSGGLASRGYKWDSTASANQTNSPNSFGWAIADTAKMNFGNGWTDQTGWTGMLKVTATLSQGLTASDATGSGATLTIANYTGSWWYQATSGPHTTCQGPVSGTSQHITNLTGGATYTYSAYRDSGCSTLLATAAAFTTPTVAASNIGKTSATLVMSNYAGAQWWYKADSGPHIICTGPTSTRDPLTLSSLSVGTTYQYTVYSKAGCSKDDIIIQVSFTTVADPVLTVTNTADTSATLTIANHTGNWYYKADAAPDNTCQGPVATTSKNLTGLSSGASYIYKAYSDSTCTTANLLATAASFTTGQSYVTNLSSSKAGQTFVSATETAAVAFTTGASVNGYTLTSITAPLRSLIDRSTNLITVTLHQMSGTGAYSTSSTPSDTVLATLSGTAPTDGTWADTTYTCSGSGCSLSANTTYFVLAKSSSTVGYAWAYATTNTETTYPSNSGWDIGYGHQKGGVNRPWASSGDYHPVKVDFTTAALPTLASSNVSATGATLTIANHTGNWYYQANTGPDASCSTTAETGTTKTLSSLTAGKVYAYTAYSASGCADANRIATAVFGTPGTVSASNLTANSTNTSHPIDGYGQGFTTGSVASTLNTARVEFADVFGSINATVSLREAQANGKPATTDRASLSGTPQKGQQSNFTCTSGGNNDCSLETNTKYFIYVSGSSGFLRSTASNAETLAPSANGWSIEDAMRRQPNFNLAGNGYAMKISVSATAPTSASLTATSTTLTIGNYTGSWYYRANTGPHATCQGPVSGTSQTISGLTSGTSYTYKAYADSACSALLATSAAFTP